MRKVDIDTLGQILTGGAERDFLDFINAGADPCWQDGGGRTLLHFAAAYGFSETARMLVGKGASPAAEDYRGDTPADIAGIFGFDLLARDLTQAMENENRQLAGQPLPVKSLADIREQKGMMRRLARQGRIKKVIALAAATGEKPRAEDFLQSKDGGKTALAVLCEKGAIADILDPAVWARSPDEFAVLWSHVPLEARTLVDIQSFTSTLSQHRMKARRNDARPPKWKAG